MSFARKVWTLLVAMKDAMVLALLLLFFLGLYGALSARGGAEGGVRKGALLIRLAGAIVEEPQEADPFAALSGGGTAKEVRERDVVRALKAAATDSRIKAVAVDASEFTGGGIVHLEEIGAAMDAARKAGKPVLFYGTMLEDAGVLLAAHASEVWLDPLGGAMLPGPGGYHLYFGKLLDRLKITAHIYRVGTYKDFVEPYFRNDQSAPSRAAREALYAAIWGELRADIAHARPQAKVDAVIADPVGWLKDNGGDPAKAALAAGLVDRLGTRADWGTHVAALAGDGDGKRPGSFAHTTMAAFLAAHPEERGGKPVGVVTVAGEIVDGKEGPGVAGGERIARAIDSVEAKGISAIVLRVDSPGGSVTGSEAIRSALARQRKRGIPVVVSMANVAASGGYWVSTQGSKIYAAPGTITGSIGIFAVIPSFEKLLAGWGVTGDGVRTTPLSGQPDVMSGLTPEVEAMLQADIEAGYARFVGLVSASRHKTTAEVDAIAQGRVWDGASARRIGLVDGYGSLDEAMAEAAREAHLGKGEWHPEFLGQERKGVIGRLLESMRDDDEDAGDEPPARDWAGLVAERQRDQLASALAGVEGLVAGGGARAWCLACEGLPGIAPTAPRKEGTRGRGPVAEALALFARGL